ncbi:MAG: D-glycero-beta-D-manno-heptose 1-phosphate adenylyltransferase [Ignavibacteriales bacterium]|nr:D-glycero-beta-D-manno-heptose 1-phosphate adenylyltransferase [Ignavibacteriales bacterium]
MVYSLKELTEQLLQWKRLNKKVVFTNGVFDILHRGHIEYLLSAKKMGDVLVVGVNSDSSVRRIKGPLRPIVNEQDRAFILSQLSCVDAVCLFDEETPYNLITAVVPDVLVKGADYTIGTIVGRDIVEKAGGHVQTIEFVPDRSTTGIVETIVQRFSKPQ